jgi:acyl-CoA synthetase (AMP-forming)/AMP-acid ligase II
MPDQLIRRCLDGFGCDFALLFGQTEMSPVTTLFRPEYQLSHIGAVGMPITGVHGCKVPKSVIVVDELPKTSTGKIQKNVIRDQHASHYAS